MAPLLLFSTLPPPASLLGRRDVVVSSGGDENSGLSGGAVAGIVIGSAAGFLLLLWILACCCCLGARPSSPRYNDGPRRRKRRGRSHSHYYREAHPVRTASRRGYSTEIPVAVSERVSMSVAEPAPVVVRSHSHRPHGRSPRRSSRAGAAYIVEETTAKPGYRHGGGQYYESY